MFKRDFYNVNEKVLCEVKEKLKPINNWDDFRVGDYIFSIEDLDLKYPKVYKGRKSDKTIICSDVSGENLREVMDSGWLEYDEFIIERIEYENDPKLYMVYNSDTSSGHQLIVATNPEDLIETFSKINKIKFESQLEFFFKYETDEIKNVCGFDIKLD